MLPKKIVLKGEIPRQLQISKKKKKSHFTYFTCNQVLILSTKRHITCINKQSVSPHPYHIKVRQIYKEWNYLPCTGPYFPGSRLAVVSLSQTHWALGMASSPLPQMEMSTWSQLILKTHLAKNLKCWSKEVLVKDLELEILSSHENWNI